MSIKKHQGGISLGFGAYTLKFIKSYQPKWTHMYDTSNSFENWDFTQVKTYKGKQFSAQITTGLLPESEYKELLKVLQSRIFTFTSEDYTGQVEVSEAPSTLEAALPQGKFWTVNFNIVATSIVGSGSL